MNIFLSVLLTHKKFVISVSLYPSSNKESHICKPFAGSGIILLGRTQNGHGQSCYLKLPTRKTGTATKIPNKNQTATQHCPSKKHNYFV